MRKNIRIISLLVIISFGLTLSGCYKSDKYIFVDSTFNYVGDPVNFYDNTYIEVFKIALSEISEEEFISRNNENVIRNHLNSKCYEVNITLKFSDEDSGSQYSFDYLGKIGDRSDGYQILLKLDNESEDLDADLTIILQFLGPIGSSTASEETAGRISVVVIKNEINGVVDNANYIDFPALLYIEEGK
ncbi:MAG: hypothetical protein WCY80_00955 [Candidatus Izemoplasmatales bacterium]